MDVANCGCPTDGEFIYHMKERCRPPECPSCAAKDARIIILQEKAKEELNQFIEASRSWMLEKEKLLARIKELESALKQDRVDFTKALRDICGALGEFYGKGQGTAVEKINFMRKDYESRLALLEKVARLTEEYLKWKNSRCIACDDGIDEEECTCTRDLEYAHKAEDKLNAALDALKEG